LTGAPAITLVADDVAEEEPALLVAVTTTWSFEPTSALPGT
jgi:hypothetical protein